MPIRDYVEMIHSQNGFSRELMTAESAAAFDSEVTAAITPFASENEVSLLSDGDWTLHNDVTLGVGPSSVSVRADKGGQHLGAQHPYDTLDVGLDMAHR